MDRETTLDQFVDAGSGDAADDRDASGDADVRTVGADAEGTAASGRAEAAASEDATADATETSGGNAGAVEPTVATYQWTPTGRDCPTCGESAAVLWRDGDAFVCESCKRW